MSRQNLRLPPLAASSISSRSQDRRASKQHHVPYEFVPSPPSSLLLSIAVGGHRRDSGSAADNTIFLAQRQRPKHPVADGLSLKSLPSCVIPSYHH